MTLIKSKRSVLDGKWILTFVQDSWWRRMCGKRPAKLMFIGDVTVWHTYPHFKRCGTSMEFKLSEVRARLEHDELLRGEFKP